MHTCIFRVIRDYYPLQSTSKHQNTGFAFKKRHSPLTKTTFSACKPVVIAMQNDRVYKVKRLDLEDKTAVFTPTFQLVYKTILLTR